MALTSNKSVLKWVDEMVALTKPDKVVWIDGSEEQLEALRVLVQDVRTAADRAEAALEEIAL